MARKKPKFLRIGYTQYSKLGLRRKKKQKYRKAKGGENKIRLKMKGHLTNVSIGYRSEKKTRGLIKGFSPKIIISIEDLKNLNKNQLGICAKLGKKKKIAIAEYALKNNIKLMNLNSAKFLDKVEEDRRKEKKEKKNREKKKIESEKKAKEKKQEPVKKVEKEESGKLEDAVKNYETDVKEDVEEIKSTLSNKKDTQNAFNLDKK